MLSPKLLERVASRVRQHCAVKGYVSGPNWNPLEPHDPVAALAMARSLIKSGRYDHFIAVAPEGHIYGFFFELLGAQVREVFVDYPPREVTGGEALSVVTGGRVLVIEDDVVSGVSLGLVVKVLEAHRPAMIDVYLGRRSEGQFLENLPAGVGAALLAESLLDPADRLAHEAEFVRLFGSEPSEAALPDPIHGLG